MQCIVNVILARKLRKFIRGCVDGEFENGIFWLPVFKAPLKHRYFIQWYWHWPTQNYKVNQRFIKYSIILNMRMSGQRWSKCPFQCSGAVDILQCHSTMKQRQEFLIQRDILSTHYLFCELCLCLPAISQLHFARKWSIFWLPIDDGLLRANGIRNKPTQF